MEVRECEITGHGGWLTSNVVVEGTRMEGHRHKQAELKEARAAFATITLIVAGREGEMRNEKSAMA